jgi:Fe2+ or Zn2+ uptake regulation protein
MYPSCGFSSKVRAFLHQQGVRATLPRIKIFSELTTTGNSFFSADEIYQRLQLKNEIIAISTVYKTLKSLCQYGLLIEENDSWSRNSFFKKTDEFTKFQNEPKL